MKIQLDTTNKTIKIEENILISKLINTLKGLLPNNEWKKYTLETHTVINNWGSPYIIKEIPIYPRPYYPAYPTFPWYTTVGKTTTEYKVENQMSLKSGVFNVELKAQIPK